MIEYAHVIDEGVKLINDAGDTLEEIPWGSIVAIIEHTNSEKYKIIHNSYTGYAMSKYLNIIGENDQNDNNRIMISISTDCANELYEAIKNALGK